jgi:hypothetical protein
LSRTTYDDDDVLSKQPDMIIQGGPALKHYHILSDRRHIITKDSNNTVTIYDVLQVMTNNEYQSFRSVSFDVRLGSYDRKSRQM